MVRHATLGSTVLAVALGVAASATIVAVQPAPLDVTVVTRATQQGEILRIDVTCACGTTAPLASAFGVDVPLARVADTRWRGVAGIDLETKPGTYPLIVKRPDVAGAEHTTSLNIIPGLFLTRQLRVAPRFVDPPRSEVPRILSEARTLEALFHARRPSAALVAGGDTWNGPFVAPTNTLVSSNFGSRSVFNGEPRSPHAGVDLSAATGTPVHAPAGGRIVLAGDLYFTGRTVVIDHGLGVQSLLAHLSELNVKTGDAVERGALVGLSGATGRVTAPHLHWSVRVNGARVDPLALLAVARD